MDILLVAHIPCIAGQVANVAARGRGSPGVSAGLSVQITGNP